MRIIVRGKDEVEVNRKIAHNKKSGWEPICKIQPDPSSWDFVCVMENKDVREPRKSKWNSPHW